MSRVIFLFTLITCVGALKLNRKPGEEKDHKTGCGVVQYAFGAAKYTIEGLRASKYIRSLPVNKGWCQNDPDLNHIPVTLFTDDQGASFMKTQFAEIDPQSQFQEMFMKGAASTNSSVTSRYQWQNFDIVVLREPSVEDMPLALQKDLELDKAGCGPGVDCAPENALPPYPAQDGKVTRLAGGWKLRWYHAQVLLQSPYTMTFYLDVDAVPCSGEGLGMLADTMFNEKADVGVTVHHGSCQMAPGKKCNKYAPEGTDAKGWSKFYERNAGCILANMAEGSEGRKIMEDYAQEIVEWAGKANGDQFAYRRALYKHYTTSKQHTFGNDEVCRYKGGTHPNKHVIRGQNACAAGCKGVAHLVGNEQNAYIPADIPLPQDLAPQQ